MRIWAYTLFEHLNFAPHISGELWSLANCVPSIRAKRDLLGMPLVGFTPVRMGRRRIAYVAVPQRALTHSQYWESYGRDVQLRGGEWWQEPGVRLDCVYAPVAEGWLRIPQPWHEWWRVAKDTRVDRVLVSRTYYNFSSGYDGFDTRPSGLAVPDEYLCTIEQVARRSNNALRGVPVHLPDDFLQWVAQQPTKVLLTLDDFEFIP